MVDLVLCEGAAAPGRHVVVSAREAATVADLVQAAGGGGVPDPAVVVDDVVFAGATSLTDVPLHHGARVVIGGRRPLEPEDVATEDVAAVEVAVVAGLDAGHRFALAAGQHVIGRAGPAAQVDVPVPGDTVSARHAAVIVRPDGGCEIGDLGSRNGVRVGHDFVTARRRLAVDDVVRLGAVHVAVRPPCADRAVLPVVSAVGVVTLDRPPRERGTSAPRALPVPAALKTGFSPRFSWSTVLAPLVLGAVMALAMPGNRMFLLFMLLSPVLAVANWVEERRRARREGARGRAGLRQQLADFAADLVREQQQEVRRRRGGAPDLPETLRRAVAPSTRLWERRPGHDDFGLLSVGHADQPWLPPLDEPAERAAEVEALLAGVPALPALPVVVRLAPGRTVGLAGPRPEVLALARSLVMQAAVHHGPADLPVAVLTEPSRTADWDWAKWLPHVRTSDGGRLLAAEPEDRAHLLTSLTEASPDGPLQLVVMDADGLTAGRGSPARELLLPGGPAVCAVVVAVRVDDLPAACTDIVEVTDPDGVARYGEPASGGWVDGVLLTGLSAGLAAETAQRLARYDDADLVEPGAALPAAVPLATLLSTGELTAEALAARWSGPRTGRLAAPIGVVADRPLVIDLVTDGPHALVAGTTGAGKSELLRTLVASLAAAYSPRDVNFVLIDYKGGSAFADCARLPHTVGLVTDLDPRLGARALTCLEAELRHRERVLRAAGVPDLASHIAAGEPGESLPRLLVVIDEFATMAAELPDFIDSLVGIAQRGRSLGVHLVLATQRPTGSVKDNIRANTNLRIALRVQDAADSTDVIGTPVAASVSRRRPGRGFVRLGPGEVVAFQSALVSTSTAADARAPRIVVSPLDFGPTIPVPGSVRVDAAGDDRPADELDDLRLLVDAAREAAARLLLKPPRQPWPEPLPPVVSLSALPGAQHAAGWCAPIGLVDEPAEQRRGTYAWRSGGGGLLLYGVTGSGTSTALATIALSLAQRYLPEDMHLYILDFGTQLLAPLAELPHVGAVIAPADRERQERLVRWLRSEVSRRQDLRRETGSAGVDPEPSPAGGGERLPAIVLLLDNWSAFEAAFDDLAGTAVRDDLVRVIADGPGLDIFAIISADRAMGVPSSVASLVPEKLVFRLSEAHDYGAFGLPARDLPEFVPGRAVDVTSRCEVQLALPGEDDLALAVAAHGGTTDAGKAYGRSARTAPCRTRRLPKRIQTLPDEIKLDDLAQGARVSDDEWWLPIGIGDRALEPVGLRLGQGDHALVAGAARSGKTTLLCTLAAAVTQPPSDVVVVAVAARRSALREAPECDHVYDSAELAAAVETVLASERPVLLLVDDADRVEDPHGCLRKLIEASRPGDRVVAAGRADVLRTSYGHWTEAVRRSRHGVVLKPRQEVDGDIWGMLLPRHAPGTFTAGRGYLVSDGEVELVQVARP